MSGVATAADDLIYVVLAVGVVITILLGVAYSTFATTGNNIQNNYGVNGVYANYTKYGGGNLNTIGSNLNLGSYLLIIAAVLGALLAVFAVVRYRQSSGGTM